jgi:hypothetical protein
MLIAGNWKMFPGRSGSLAGLDMILCPPRVHDCVQAGLTTYAQNVLGPEGAHGEIPRRCCWTGVVAPPVDPSSDRYFGERPRDRPARQAGAASEAGLNGSRARGDTSSAGGEMETPGANWRCSTRIPTWCSRTSRSGPSAPASATPEMAQERTVHQVAARRSGALAKTVADNAGTLLAQPDVDGALVGGASLEIDSFKAICQTAARIPS